jgi:hypothetical protein
MRTCSTLTSVAVLGIGAVLGWLAGPGRRRVDPRSASVAAQTPPATLRHPWNAGPAMKVVAEFEASLKKYPPIAPGTPDPYTPPK